MNKNIKLGFVKSKAYGLCGVILTAALLVIMSPNVYADEASDSTPTTELISNAEAGKAHYEKTGETLKSTPAQYKEDFPWLKEVDSLALCNVQLNLNKAYKSFYQSGFGFPKFKSK